MAACEAGVGSLCSARIAVTAVLLGDPARANMRAALLDGRALTAKELGCGTLRFLVDADVQRSALNREAHRYDIRVAARIRGGQVADALGRQERRLLG